MSDNLPKNLWNEVGHLIRRCHQINQAYFSDEVSHITAVQGVVLKMLVDQPGIAQRRLAEIAGLDEVTLGGVVKRLVERGLVERAVNPEDRRARRLTITEEGEKAWKEAVPGLKRLQTRLLAPLDEQEIVTLKRLLRRLAESHDHMVHGTTLSEGGQPLASKKAARQPRRASGG